MKQIITSNILFTILLSVLCGGVFAQQHVVQAKNGLNARPRNYTFFTAPNKDNNPEVVKRNSGFEQHPELGVLFAETPCDNCVELIGNRTEISKTFIKEGTDGREMMRQTSTAPIHYKDALGNWRTVQTQLKPSGSAAGIFSAPDQEAPVTINPSSKSSSLGKPGQLLQFNNNLELIYAKPDGTQQFIGSADYSHYTAGDDGVYITNAWPGIDIEMYVARGGIKTNFIINHALPAWAAGKLLVRDHIGMNTGWSLYVPGENKHQYAGNLEVRNSAGDLAYYISAATAYEQNAAKTTLQYLDYLVAGNLLDIALPGSFLNRPAGAYPVIIDPLVSLATSTPVALGSAYSPGWTVACPYTNPATVPAGLTVTDVQFSFSYTTSGGAHINNGANDFKVGTCRSPSAPGYWWRCTDTGVGTCNEIGVTIFPEISACIPPPQCTPYDLNVLMNFYQNFAPTYISCSPAYISALGQLTVTVIGHTAEPHVISASHDTVCQGQSATLSATAYGVAPITYSWAPGGLTGSTVTVNPTATTVYTLTVTDACGNASSLTHTIYVNPIGAISGVTTVCVGGTTTLSDIGGPGTWVSSNPAKATVGSTTGIVTGLVKGNVTITYTSLAGCSVTAPVSIKSAVAPVLGAGVICQGSTTTLSDTTSSGTWSSSSSAIASVSGTGGIGVATGVSGGYATITYSIYGGGCFAIKNLTVNALAPITGISSICLGATTTLSDAAPGGSWTSSNPGIAVINATTGVVNSISAGVDTITYTLPSGCATTRALTISLLSPVTGSLSACQGGTTTLSHAIPGGTWTSGNPAVATINPTTGLVSGLTTGLAGITYTIAGGCSAIAVVTVNPIPPVSGTPAVCLGGTTMLTDGAGPGTWSSSNNAIATVSPAGMVSGTGVGICTITYTSMAGCTATISMNVSLATPSTGITTVCPGGTVTLSNITPGGIWSSANPGIAAVDSLTGIVTGVSGGTVAIMYTNPSGCTVNTSVTVNPISSITGLTSICIGGTSTLSNYLAGGSWSTSSPGIATVDAGSGLVTGISMGTANITYTSLAGCTTWTAMTVGVPAPVMGVTYLCQGVSTILMNSVSGGTWSSSNTSVATIDPASGLLMGLIPGNTDISYVTAGGCNAMAIVTVNPVAPVSGSATVCAGSSTTLANSVPGGTWSSANPAVAVVGTGTGIVTGTASGTTTIIYTSATGCITGLNITVNPTPSAITGSMLVCTSTTLSDGVAGGTWSSSNTAVAVIGASSGIASGLSPGTVTITYTLPGGCFTTATLTVDPLQPITGIPNVCLGSTSTLSYPVTGGTWSSLAPAVATVNTSGVVTGIAAGTTTISYVTTTGCVATTFVTVNPVMPVTGSAAVCQGSNITLANAIPGGSWSTSDGTIAPVGATTGIVVGAQPGSVTISYTTLLGCTSVKAVTVNPLAATTGNPSICAGSSTMLSNTTPGGGTWSSLAPLTATVNPVSGMVTGILTGTATIRFTSGLGCMANFIETINPMPSAIIGALAVCMGSTTTLSNTLTGGTWSSSNTAVATVGSITGVLAGVSPNTVTVSYSSGAGCAVSAVVTVNPLPLAITGVASMCAGASVTLNDATISGTWSSINPAIATVNTSGVVTGVSAGTTFIKYSTPAGCFMTRQVTVNAMPSAIGGTTVVCEGANTTLTNTLASGTWNSSNSAIATVGSLTGLLTGVTAGNAVITYITGSGCFVVAPVTVNPTPAISGTSSTNPTTCINADGTITLNGLHAGESYTVHYNNGAVPVSVLLTANGAGKIIIAGLAAGSYSNFSVTTSLGCTSNVVAAPIVLSLPPVPATPVAGNNTPICAGTTLKLTASDATAGVTYLWSGPGGYTSTLQNPTIAATVVAMSGTYSVTATKLACVSAPAATIVVVHPIPHIGQVTSLNPGTCKGTDGVIMLSGLDSGVTYNIGYTGNGIPGSTIATADGSGKVTITGLGAGNYVGFVVSSFTCISNSAGPVTLVDPAAPPAPTVYSNSPICAGQTLTLSSNDAISNITYDWSGPNNFTSNQQNPVIPNITMPDSGLYTLTIRHLNCPTTVTENVLVHPAVVLSNITPDQIVPLGGSIRLYAVGAEFYMWSPNDGTLDNPNIDSPLATPQEPVTYSVKAMNTWGCLDTASVRISIDYNVTEFMPNAFTPNNDGYNDIFRVGNVKYDKIVEFKVFNRWGQLVYDNNYEPTAGWDGTFHGVPQDVGTYYYSIILTRPDGKNKTFNGEVILIR